MDQKNRVVFSAAVILLIFAALLISFGRIFFNTHTPDVVLPHVSENSSDGSGSTGQTGQDYGQQVSVTAQTVQSVIATLDRTDSYYRELTVEQFWTGGSSSGTIQVWTDQEWSLVRQLLPSNVVRQDLIGPETAYYWYEGSSRYESTPANRLSADLAQRLPTYETVLELDPLSITGAGYELKGDIPCIYVQSLDSTSNNVKHYWVSVDSGLLVCAELYRENTLIYRMSSFSPIQSPCPAGTAFQLPDGTVLHEP